MHSLDQLDVWIWGLCPEEEKKTDSYMDISDRFKKSHSFLMFFGFFFLGLVLAFKQGFKYPSLGWPRIHYITTDDSSAFTC